MRLKQEIETEIENETGITLQSPEGDWADCDETKMAA